ncbi:hypothetical protein E2562_012615 [Oryza meyeriana var. granulata]|uniref:Pentatricopeptide repeat-containing protein n=1 Tax=Oryza meyeriana var. granulata TaxID=110450 RepID=A0A6G1CEJ6_9ORYZ|nr:hypothetical protein E2562_012615 [Oryza meyeriana var. granulata]
MVADKSGVASPTPWNQLLTAYSHSPAGLAAARRVFDEVPRRDAVSWNALLAAHVASGAHHEAWRLLRAMHVQGLAANTFALGSALRSGAAARRPAIGAQLQSLALKSGLANNVFAASALLDVYAKCGRVRDARQVFDGMPERNTVSWNALIAGYTESGVMTPALQLFLEMEREGLVPDEATFASLLTAVEDPSCFLMHQLHDEGSEILNTMETRYGIPLRMEHYACGVDLYGRAGQLDKAKDLIDSMPFEPDAMVWMTLLGACRIHGNVELASDVASHLFVAEPRQHSTYVLLSSMYSGLGMWDDRATVQRVMKKRGLSKVPGWSWIEVKNEVHSFNAEDKSHPKMDEIYDMLRVLLQVEQMLSYCEDEDILTIISSAYELEFW